MMGSGASGASVLASGSRPSMPFEPRMSEQQQERGDLPGEK